MDIESVREYCLSFPHATENVQWGEDLVFKVSGKMFTVVGLDSVPNTFSFKCTPEEFAELVEREGIMPARYAARYHWVTVMKADTLERAEIKRLIRKSYDLVWAKLPRKARLALTQGSVQKK